LRQETVEASVVFLGHRGCSEAIEKETPDVVFRHLNAHLDFIVPEIASRGGTVTRFVGPVAMAVFDGEDHLSRALDACLGIRDCVHRLECGDSSEKSAACGVAFGLGTGTVMTGGLGSKTIGRLEHVYLGEPVTAASQLYAVAGKGELLVSAVLHPQIADRYECEMDEARRVAAGAGFASVYRVRRRARSRYSAHDEAPPSCSPTLAKVG
jgi:class 3 adenylate cyclase